MTGTVTGAVLLCGTLRDFPRVCLGAFFWGNTFAHRRVLRPKEPTNP